ncbi:integrase domain-containing protein [Noviherbaspirillum sp. Root189]|uniref:integrase domain-containing protein n=1 Tax=Noviherbaspirillum sp. Root189 TaxID=1736487 RepID=UPI00138F3FEB|nr:integrase domain-containing protein [Noviherbaspirillum sp. Root189]
MTPGSIQTSIGNVRSLLRAAGVDLTGYDTSRALGVPERNRDGTKLPFPDERFDELLVRAYEMDPGMYHSIKMQRLLGLRGLEALMSGPSIERWIDEIQYLHSVHVTSGTKGGRPRFTDILHGRATETQVALREAMEYLQHNKHLIQGKGGDLESARNRYHALARKLDMTGEFAPHSLRYAWACEKARELIDLGLGRREILSFLSTCLGHGESRGRWIKQVYIAGVVHLLPRPTRLARRLYKLLQKLDRVQTEET